MKHPDSSQFRRGLDRLGIVASSVCLVHCLATPLLVVSLPVAASEGFEGIFADVLVGFATLSVGLGVLRRRMLPLLPYSLGLSTLALLRTVDVVEGSPLELIGTTATALLMICTHLMSLGHEQPGRLRRHARQRDHGRRRRQRVGGGQQ
jgi:hypothetical protein